MTAIALIVAGGRGARFGSERPKQYEMLAGLPVIRHTVLAFRGHPAIDDVRVVIRPQDRDLYDACLGDLDLQEPIEGGAERQDSVRAGLEALALLAPDIVTIHDAARPLISATTIAAVLAAVTADTGAIAALPMTDTVKQTDGATITATLDRTRLWRAQTPQAFPFQPLLAAHRTAAGLALPDDAAVAERAGMAVVPITDSAHNLKLTSREDLDLAEYLLARTNAPSLPRIASGFDVHAFGPGDHVMLGGVRIAHDHGLVGHSDADVALHALTDALLGTLALGDIGQHFPPSDARWQGADSTLFLRHAADLLRQRLAQVCHVDLTIICERPKIGPYRDAIARRIAELLDLTPSQVSVKATTTEGLGFTGRREGIAVQAMATILAPLDRP